MYAGIPLVADLDEFLSRHGFRRVVTLWNPAGWGDALYVRPTGGRVEEVQFALASAWAVFSFRSHEFWLRTRKKFLKLRRRVYRAVDRMRGLR
jgi:ribonuclease I